MKHTAVLENIYTRELYTVTPNPNTKFVDGVEYIQVVRHGTSRPVMIRKDSLRSMDKSSK